MDFHDHVRRNENAFERLHRARRAAVRGRGVDIDECRQSLVHEETVVVEAIVQSGFILEGVGAARIVFSLPQSGKVVKVARYGTGKASSGMYQNQSEVLIWRRVHRMGCLAPIHESHFRNLWVISEKAQMLVDVAEGPSHKDRMLQSLTSELEELPEVVEATDVTEENVGVIDGSATLVDYGLSNLAPEPTTPN